MQKIRPYIRLAMVYTTPAKIYILIKMVKNLFITMKNHFYFSICFDSEIGDLEREAQNFLNESW